MPGSTRPKIGILTTSFPRFEGDNAGRFIYNFVHELNLSDYSLRVIAPDDWSVHKGLHPFHVEHFRYFFPKSMQTLAYGAGMTSRIKANPLRLFQIPFFLCSFFLSALRNAQHCQILHAYWTSAGAVAIAVKLIKKVKVVINLWGSDIIFTKIPLVWPMLAWLFNRADAIICESKHFADQIIANGISEHLITILPNGIDLEKFKPLDKNTTREQLGISIEQKVLLNVGSLGRYKGQRDLINTLPAILSEHADVHTVIVGEGEFRSQLERTIEQLNLKDKVTLAGFQVEEKIIKWLNAADIFVFPSLREGTPNALLEAMACGLPVVTTSVGAIPEIVSDGINGMLIPAGSPGKFVEAVNSLLQDPTLRQRLGEKAKETVLLNFGSWEEQCVQLKTLYSRILSEPS